MKNIACSKFWTDLNIRGHLQQITHCCRREYFNIPLSTVKEYKENLFNNHPMIIDEKSKMITTNKLTEGCASCIESWPNSDWQSWNDWQTKDWTQDELKNLPFENRIQKIEISFSNKCNFSCMYCSHYYSSSWEKLTNQKINGTNDEWIEHVLESLYNFIDDKKTYQFGFIGGEPLLDLEILSNIERLIEKIHVNPNNQIYIISNLGVKEKTLNNFLNITKKYPKIKWRLSVSIDSLQKNGELIRDGLNINSFLHNLNKVIQCNSISKLTFLPTISTLNIDTLPDTIKWMLQQKTHIEKISNITVSIGSNSVTDPIAMNPAILPEIYKTYVDESIKLLDSKHDNFKRHLEVIKNKIGTMRDKKILEQSKTWYEEQGKIKNKKYIEEFTNLEEILS